MLKNVTVTVEEDALRWARLKAADENTSVSKLVGRMLAEQMQNESGYWKAYESLKRIKPIPGLAAKRLTRAQAKARH